MENASKALIIAGAILLAIVIISLGLIVVNNTRSTMDQANMSEQEIQTFNAKFTPYEGTNISGSRAKTLIQTIIASNQSNPDKIVKVTYTSKDSTSSANCTDTSDTAKLSNVSADISTGKNYSITFSYTNSLVSTVTIK